MRIAAAVPLGVLLALAGSRGAESPEARPAVQVEASADPTRATVGDRILVKVTVIRPREVTVTPPLPSAEGESALLVEAVKPKPSGTPGRAEPGRLVREVFFFQAQAFEPGATRIPAFHVEWRGANGASGGLATDPIPVEIVSVLKGPGAEPSDLKPPAQLPPPPFPWRWLGWLLLAAFLMAMGAYAWYRRRRPRAAAAPANPGPILPPHEQAYRDLERLLASGLLQEGKLKEFHVELAEIAKRYLAGRFGIETLERTSEEVLDDLKRVRVGAAPLGTAREFFCETDLVKFAKYLPREEEIRKTVERAYRLVDQTKLVSSPAPPAVGQAPRSLNAERAG